MQQKTLMFVSNLLVPSVPTGMSQPSPIPKYKN